MTKFLSISLVIVLLGVMISFWYVTKKYLEEKEELGTKQLKLTNAQLDFWQSVSELKEEIITILRSNIEFSKEIENRTKNND